MFLISEEESVLDKLKIPKRRLYNEELIETNLDNIDEWQLFNTYVPTASDLEDETTYYTENISEPTADLNNLPFPFPEHLAIKHGSIQLVLVVISLLFSFFKIHFAFEIISKCSSVQHLLHLTESLYVGIAIVLYLLTTANALKLLLHKSHRVPFMKSLNFQAAVELVTMVSLTFQFFVYFLLFAKAMNLFEDAKVADECLWVLNNAVVEWENKEAGAHSNQTLNSSRIIYRGRETNFSNIADTRTVYITCTALALTIGLMICVYLLQYVHLFCVRGPEMIYVPIGTKIHQDIERITFCSKKNKAKKLKQPSKKPFLPPGVFRINE